MTIAIQKIEDPIFPDPANGVKGRKSYKITGEDGTTYFAGDVVGQDLKVGYTYDNLEVNQDKYKNNWLNFADMGTKPQQTPSPASSRKPDNSGAHPAPQHTPPPQEPQIIEANPTPANIFLQGMLQQAIASGVHDPTSVWNWAVENYPNFRDRKPMTPFPHK